MKKSSRILVAGGTGMVGSAILRRLVSLGHDSVISTFHRKPPAAAGLRPVRFEQVDLTRQADTESLFQRERPEYVFLAAAKVGGILANSTYKAEFIYDNIAIATNIIHSSYRCGVIKLLNIGSSCIYPKLAPQPLREEYLLTSALEPTNEPYAIAKIAAIKLCRYYNEQHGTDFMSVMPANLYGPGDNFDFENSHVLAALIRKFHLAKLLAAGNIDLIKEDLLRHGNCEVRSGNSRLVISASSPDEDIRIALKHFGIMGSPSVTVELWGTGEPYREFLHVDDLAAACIDLLRNHGYREIGELINIGTGEDVKVKDLAVLVKEVVGFDGRIKYDHTKPDGTPRKLLDVTRIRGFGWQASIRLEEGIRKAYHGYVAQRGDGA